MLEVERAEQLVIGIVKAPQTRGTRHAA
jgi:hypothetical protein